MFASNILLALGILFAILAVYFFFRFRIKAYIDRVSGKAEREEMRHILAEMENTGKVSTAFPTSDAMDSRDFSSQHLGARQTGRFSSSMLRHKHADPYEERFEVSEELGTSVFNEEPENTVPIEEAPIEEDVPPVPVYADPADPYEDEEPSASYNALSSDGSAEPADAADAETDDTESGSGNTVPAEEIEPSDAEPANDMRHAPAAVLETADETDPVTGRLEAPHKETDEVFPEPPDERAAAFEEKAEEEKDTDGEAGNRHEESVSLLEEETSLLEEEETAILADSSLSADEGTTVLGEIPEEEGTTVLDDEGTTVLDDDRHDHAYRIVKKVILTDYRKE